MRKVRLDGIRMQRESATTEYRESLVFVNPAYEPGLTGVNAAARVFPRSPRLARPVAVGIGGDHRPVVAPGDRLQMHHASVRVGVQKMH